MNDPRHIAITEYNYPLPENSIAKYPLPERDASRLLIFQNGVINEDIYHRIARHIPENSVLVFNNTKVVAARLQFIKPTGGSIEIFCLEPHEDYPDISTAMIQKEKVRWHCLVGGAAKWKPGQVLQKKIPHGDTEIILSAHFIEKSADSFIIGLSWTPVHLSFAEVLHFAGAIPLPPYIKRAAEASDTERYQTIYSVFDGSVAAPTAGLHFTSGIFDALAEKKIQTDFVTLHVGAGTFKPVKTDLLEGHEMHAEWIDVPISFIEKLLNNLNNNIIAVGTTSLRTIESLYWLGVQISNKQSKQPIALLQWEPYDTHKKNISPKESLQLLAEWMHEMKLENLIAKTQLLIAPGYDFKIVNGLITNFHQPQSTLLVLIDAFIGKDWRKVYDYALQKDFRFLSYGDGSLLWNSVKPSLTEGQA